MENEDLLKSGTFTTKEKLTLIFKAVETVLLLTLFALFLYCHFVYEIHDDFTDAFSTPETLSKSNVLGLGSKKEPTFEEVKNLTISFLREEKKRMRRDGNQTFNIKPFRSKGNIVYTSNSSDSKTTEISLSSLAAKYSICTYIFVVIVMDVAGILADDSSECFPNANFLVNSCLSCFGLFLLNMVLILSDPLMTTFFTVIIASILTAVLCAETIFLCIME